MKIETEHKPGITRKTPPTKPLVDALTAVSPVKPELQTARSRSRKAPSAKATQKVKVTFALLEPHARRVTLSGGFNAWSPDATPMKRGNDGLWQADLTLEPGRYEYKFVVDGQWLPDPNAQENSFNGYGTLNSVVEVRA